MVGKDSSIVSPPSTGVEAGEGLPACLGASRADVLALFLRVLPPDFFAQLGETQELRQNNRVYNYAVVIWLMIVQRLHGNGSLETAVLELVRGLPKDFWPQPCKRLQSAAQDGKLSLSSNTGSYNNARQEFPLTVLEQCCDRVWAQLNEPVGAPEAAVRRRAFFLDGSSVRMMHSEALCAAYPPGCSQHGESHWPLLRILVAHDLYTGVAMRPQWGAMNGAEAVSEQGLLKQAIDRLPRAAIVVGDANFGVFSVAYASTERDHPVVLRMTMARARSLTKGELQDGMDLQIQWTPTRDDRRSHPELPADASVSGRLIVRRVQPSDGSQPFLLPLFTTLKDEAGSIFELYGRRWDIETDLNCLKSTLRLDQLTCSTVEMVAKEIDVAILAYNLVRALMWVAAQKAGLKPRQFSFTRCRNVMQAFAPLIAAAADEREAQRLFDKMMYYVGQAKLPTRHRKRPSYPRAVWPKTQKYPKRKE